MITLEGRYDFLKRKIPIFSCFSFIEISSMEMCRKLISSANLYYIKSYEYLNFFQIFLNKDPVLWKGTKSVSKHMTPPFLVGPGEFGGRRNKMWQITCH
jgi:hypothetical protein